MIHKMEIVCIYNRACRIILVNSRSIHKVDGFHSLPSVSMIGLNTVNRLFSGFAPHKYPRLIEVSAADRCVSMNHPSVYGSCERTYPIHKWGFNL